MDEFCNERIKKGYGYCERVRRNVHPLFCMYKCRGDWSKNRREDIFIAREKYRQPLTEEQKRDKDIVSVIIPARESEKLYIKRTIDNLYETSRGPIEIVLCLDGWNGQESERSYPRARIIRYTNTVGQRKIVNDAALFATGKYLFRLDAHCAMSPDWDARMKSSCGSADLVAPVFDHLDLEAWKGCGVDIPFWRLDSKLRCRTVRPWKPLGSRKPEEDLMAISGGAWMIQKDYYLNLGGHDESLGGHGAVGTEWSLKVWLTGGRVILRTDVVCAHLFRAKLPFAIDMKKKNSAFKKLYKQWVMGEDARRTKPMEWLLYKFNNYTKWRGILRVKNATV